MPRQYRRKTETIVRSATERSRPAAAFDISSVPATCEFEVSLSLRDVGNIWLLFRRKTTLCPVCTKADIVTTNLIPSKTRQFNGAREKIIGT